MRQSVTAVERIRAWWLHSSLVLGLFFGFVSWQAQPAFASPNPLIKTATQQLLQAINADRARLHVRPLVLDTRQSSCSRRHSKHMALAGGIAHDQFPADICVAHTYAAENVGSDPTTDVLTAVMQLNTMMMDEGPCPDKKCPGTEFEDHGHYMNLVSPNFTHIGIGIVVKNSTVWLTENFTG
jgi:uncharacterized protein YkwD